jgi:alpha-tubulin suppressor-like RCC1 family protein
LKRDEHKFFKEHYLMHNNEKGNLHTWGSGEMGQLGYSSEVITKMPKDREGYPFQPYPLEIKQLRNKGIY